jgi:protein TonB
MASPKDEPIVAESVELPQREQVVPQQPEAVLAQTDYHEDTITQQKSDPDSPLQTFEAQAGQVMHEKFLQPPDIAGTAASVMLPPEVESPRDSDSLQVKTELVGPTVLRRPAPITRPIVSRIARPDYTWLMNTLVTKLEQVKIYPPSAKATHIQGRVLVQVSIQRDGHIEDVDIEESSGHPVLDLAAQTALRAVSPLDLDHQIEEAPVIMLVPLNYQLE